MFLSGFLLLSAIAWSNVSTPTVNGVSAPEPSEKRLKDRLASIRASKLETLPGDNFPRRYRLLEALNGLAAHYHRRGRTAKAEALYDELLGRISSDTSEIGIDLHRFYREAIARQYLERDQLEPAEKHARIAAQLCRQYPREKQTLPGVLGVIAQIESKKKNWPAAESALVEAIALTRPYGENHKAALIDVYLDSGQLDKAEAALGQTSGAGRRGALSIPDSTSLAQRARLLRARGKSGDAAALEAAAITNGKLPKWKLVPPSNTRI